MYITETTANERGLIQNALYGAFDSIDMAHRIIMDELEDYFQDYDQKEICASDAERIGRHLQAAADMIFYALLEYHLTVGDYKWRGVEPYLIGAKRVQAAIRTKDAHKKCYDLQRKAGYYTETGKKLSEEQAKLRTLPDDQAAPLLEALARENERALTPPDSRQTTRM